MTTLRIDESLRAYIDPLTEDEYAALERSLLDEGCRDALVLWGDLLVDGHNRYGICRQHGIAFQTVQNNRFRSIEDVHLWMIDNHLGRRSVSDYQRGVLALRKKEILSARASLAASDARVAIDPSGRAAIHATDAARASDATDAADSTDSTDSTDAAVAATKPSARAQAVLTRQALARAARLSSATLGQIERIDKSAAPELVEAVKTGLISIPAAAELASLPQAEQSAAAAGGKQDLRALARRARAARKPATAEPVALELPPDATPEQVEIARLKHALAGLTAERDQLKKKVQQLTIALSQAREGDPGPAF